MFLYYFSIIFYFPLSPLSLSFSQHCRRHTINHPPKTHHPYHNHRKQKKKKKSQQIETFTSTSTHNHHIHSPPPTTVGRKKKKNFHHRRHQQTHHHRPTTNHTHPKPNHKPITQNQITNPPKYAQIGTTVQTHNLQIGTQGVRER